MTITHVHERADKAARSVDPLVLAMALDHIAKTAQRSRSQTRRLRWIQVRAEFALAGREYQDMDVDLPRFVGGDTPERLRKRLTHWRSITKKLLAAATTAEAVLAHPSADEAAAALAELREALAWVHRTIAADAEQTAQASALPESNEQAVAA